MGAQVGDSGSEGIGPGKGLLHYLKRLWFNIMIVFIGGKWGVIETFTKHRKLQSEEIPKGTSDETVVITGGARGIGAEVVKQFLHMGMNVIIGCRKPAAGEATIQQIRNEGILTGTAEALALDLNSFQSVRQFAQAVLAKNIPIHKLINNAGVMFTPFHMTVDGYESQFQTNYLSHFLLTTLLEPALHQGGKPNSPSRVINVSSAAQYGGYVNFDNIDMKKQYSPHMGYMSSKLMQVVSAIYLNRRYLNEKKNIRVYALHPGVVRTDLYENVWWVSFFGKLITLVFRTPEQGADGVVYVAISSAVNPEGGTFYANCKEEYVNPIALNGEVQEKLFQLSQELVKGASSGNGVTVQIK